ncbi:Cytochrome b/b6 domain protein [Oscillochloris trichoides DG-6]|uniref:Cytochrome b/b6 domain protein n=1 Tax=Oscillochloris trichoides DG-6 TaxID=765420 RepID=E1II42_9CHLR|nr:cytochrome b N-terminal domain-containing protein [Oscillochloris trichoides]EFO79160.1 Cytochrome b/b6 domain protein [Oscillochloris trichoides DG-6]
MAWFSRLIYRSGPPPEDRHRMRAVANSLILHLHPPRVAAGALRFPRTWGLGGISALLTMVLVVSGVLLMFRYDASVERAYSSVQALETVVPFGSLLRAIHHWAGNLLVITAVLHLVRVFAAGGFRAERRMNWLIGLGLLLLVLVFNFTGYLLPWDQLAFWAITVGTGLLTYMPLLGQPISDFLLGGPEVAQPALRNFYALHVALLPVILIFGLSYHFWRVRKDGGVTLPAESTPAPRLTTIPHLVHIELGVALITLTGLFIFAMLVPAPLEDLANPAHPPNPAKAAWYFLGVQELLLHMHPLAALLLTLIGGLGLALLPLWDRDTADEGIYFRSPTGRLAGAIGALWGLLFTPLLVLVDEYWLDLPTLLVLLPTLVSNGLLPLLLTLAGLAAIYAGLRSGLRARHSEALVGLLSFVGVALLVLTAVGIWLRGENMALIWPW